MKLTIGSRLVVTDYKPEFVNWCKQNLEFDNPDYIKKEYMGLWMGDTPKKIRLFDIDGNKSIRIPYGVAKEVKKMCDRTVSEVPKHKQVLSSYTPTRKLFDYQQKASDEMVKSVYGILQSKAGTGKTTIGIDIACRLGYKTLWLANKIDLIDQAVITAKSFVPEDMIGTIVAGKVNIGQFITFATVQTMSQLDLHQYRDMFGCVIVDEAHLISTNKGIAMFEKVLNNLNCYYKYGLSASVHRADGLIKATKAIIGDVAHIVPDDAVQDKIMSLSVNPIQLPTKIKRSWLKYDGTVIHSRLINGLCEDEQRNEIIVNNLLKSKDKHNLVLTDRVSHIEYLYNELSDHGCSVAMVTGTTPKKQRIQILDDMREGKYNYLIATYSLASTGLDIQILDTLHLTTPHKDYAMILQSCGRIARIYKDKSEPVCYDYVDDRIISLQKKFKKRCTTYKKLGYKINEMEACDEDNR